jgi:RNA recognition motif-containing protein
MLQQEDIAGHFQAFGELQSVTIKTDSATGRSRCSRPSPPLPSLIPSRGFAFVVFQSVSGLQAAAAAEGKEVSVKLFLAKQGKVYVGKLKAELTHEVIKEHFEQFGKIVQVRYCF